MNTNRSDMRSCSLSAPKITSDLMYVCMFKSIFMVVYNLSVCMYTYTYSMYLLINACM